MTTGASPRRWRLAAALLLPSLLGAVGTFALASAAATFALYLGIGCALAPALLLGARPARARGGLPFAPPGPRRPWRAEALLALLFGPVFLAAYAVSRPWLGSVAAYRERVAELGLDPQRPLVALAVFVLLNPLLEEWWWRGQALPRSAAAFGPRRGLVLAVAGFGAYHVVLLAGLFPLPLALLRAALITGAGLLWSHVALARRSWRAVWVAHLAADLAMAVLFLLVVAPRG